MNIRRFHVGLCFFLLLSSPVHAAVVLHSIAGKNISFASLKGKWVFINYWASWCEPCLAEIPNLNRFYQLKNKDAAMFGVNYDALPLKAQQDLIHQLHIEYPSLRRDPASALRLGNIQGVPVTFVFNPQGKLVQTLYGPQTVQSLNAAMSAS